VAISQLAAFWLSFAVVTILFAAIYKLVPEVKLHWKDVVIGACFTSFLFSAGKQLIGFYLGRVSYTSTYGTAGSILIILVWVYYSAQLSFFGAEFTRVYAKNARQRTDNAGFAARASLTDKKPVPISNGGSA
jgi:membrane protein